MANQPKKYKKFVATAATATLVASAIVPVASAATPEFSDITGYTADVQAAINALATQGIINGTSATTFEPGKYITRGQVVKLLGKWVEAKGAVAPANWKTVERFTDLPVDSADQELLKYAAIAYDAGVFEGNNGVLNASGNITRENMALVLDRAYDKVFGTSLVELAAKVADVNVADLATAKTQAKPAIQALKDLEISVSANFNPKGNVTRANFATFLYRALNVKIPVVAPAVESVTAINAKQLKVVFNKEVDKASAEAAANYAIKVNGSAYTGTTITATLLSDKKTVILTDKTAGTTNFTSYASILASGNSYQVTVENVTDTSYTKIAKFESEVKAFIDTTAPVVTKAEYTGGVVRVYFNEPVNPASLDYKVDGGVLSSNGAGLTSKINKEEYYVEFTPTTDQKTAGNHTVTLYDVTDALTNANAVASVNYTVSTDTTAPSVVSVTADGMYTFKVKFSEALASGTEPAVVVKKGALQLLLDTTLDANGIALDTTDSSNTTYIVKVTNADLVNKVYATGETSANLSVNVKGYTDAANLAGSEFNGSVTLVKDAVAPTVVNVGLNKGIVVVGPTNDQLNVVFNEDLDATYATGGVNDSKVTVKKDGITLSTLTGDFATIINDADGKPRVAQINLGAELSPGTYTVEFAADAVADKSGNKNAALTTSVNYTDSSVFIIPTVTTPVTNVFNVAYAGGVDLTDSALVLSNYTLDGAALPAGTTIGFYGSKQVVRITLPAGSYAKTSTGLLKVSKNVVNKDGVKALASVNPDVEATGSVSITDNVKATVTEAKYLLADSSDTTSNQIKVTFSENLANVANDVNSQNDFKVTVNGVKQTVSAVTDGTAGDKVVTLTLSGAVNTSQAATINIVAEADQDHATPANNVISVTDVATNKVTANSTVTTNGTELDAVAIAATATAKANLGTSITTATAASVGKSEVVAVGNQIAGSGATLTSAITAAQAVYNNASATAAQLTSAKTTLDAAIVTYNAATVAALAPLTGPALNATTPTLTGNITAPALVGTEVYNVTLVSAGTTGLTVNSVTALGVTATAAGTATVKVEVLNATGGQVIKTGTVTITVAP